jgi:Recombination endonuclease VII
MMGGMIVAAGEETSEQKICAKCGNVKPATSKFFYRHTASKSGLTPRCKPCIDEDNAEGHARALVKNPVRIKTLATERSRRWAEKNKEKSRENSRKCAAKRRADPITRAVINMRKRGGGAGLTLEEFEQLFDAQGRKCPICLVDNLVEKTGSQEGSMGWNIDHCHMTGEVRFILCAPCNRGLAAFRDDPEIMKRAAELLEKRKANK